MRKIVQFILFPFMVVMGGEVQAKVGTLKCKFFTWLYGNGEPIHDGWIYPE